MTAFRETQAVVLWYSGDEGLGEHLPTVRFSSLRTNKEHPEKIYERNTSMDPMVLDNHFLTNCWRRRFRSGTVLSSALPLVALTLLCLAVRCLPLHGIGIGRIHNTGDSKINTDKIGVDELDEEINKRLILARTVRSHPYFIVSLILQYNWILKPPADRTTPSITSRLEYMHCSSVPNLALAGFGLHNLPRYGSSQI